MNINNYPIIFSDKNVSVCSTHLIGYINISYKQLTKLFGQPYICKGDKVDWNWNFKLNDTVFTIYNWKNGPSYGFNIKPSSIKTWHIGGKYDYDINILCDYIHNRKFKNWKIINEKHWGRQ